MAYLINYQFETDPISMMRLLKVQAYVCPDLCSCSGDRLVEEIRALLRQRDVKLVVGDWRTIVKEESARFVEIIFKTTRVR